MCPTLVAEHRVEQLVVADLQPLLHPLGMEGGRDQLLLQRQSTPLLANADVFVHTLTHLADVLPLVVGEHEV